MRNKTMTMGKRFAGVAGLVCLLLVASAFQAAAQAGVPDQMPVPIVNVDERGDTVTAGSETYKVTSSTRLFNGEGLAITLSELRSIAMDKLNVPQPNPSDLKWATVKSRSAGGTHEELVELKLRPNEEG